MPLDQADIERLREMFVTRQECNTLNDESQRRWADSVKEIAVINTKLSLILWLLGAVGAAVITVLIKILFGA